MRTAQAPDGCASGGASAPAAIIGATHTNSAAAAASARMGMRKLWQLSLLVEWCPLSHALGPPAHRARAVCATAAAPCDADLRDRWLSPLSSLGSRHALDTRAAD